MGNREDCGGYGGRRSASHHVGGNLIILVGEDGVAIDGVGEV